MKISEVVNTTSIERFIEEIGVNKVFGSPTEEGDVTIIPVAQVEFGFGYGGGYGTGPTSNVSQEDEENTTSEADTGKWW